MSQRNPSRAVHSIQGTMLAVFVVLLILASSWLFTQRRWWMPELASLHGADIDRLFGVTLAISGVLFIILQGVLGYLAFRYGEKRAGRARYWIRPRLEKRFAIVAGIIIFGVDVTIYALGESGWLKAWGPAPAGTPITKSWENSSRGTFVIQARTASSVKRIRHSFHPRIRSVSIERILPPRMTLYPSTNCTSRKGDPSACAFGRTT